MTNKTSKTIAIYVVAAVITLMGFALFSWVCMLLWNWLMPMFGLPALTFWRMAGLLFLIAFIINIIKMLTSKK